MKKIINVIISIFSAIAFLSAGMVRAQVPQVAAISPPDELISTDVRISMDFEDAALNDVLKIFSQQSGLNFVAGEEIKDKRITLYLDNVSVQDALNSVINANNLTYEQPAGSNIFIVRELGISPVKLITRVYYFKYARVKSSRLNQEIESNLGSTDEEGEDEGGEGTEGGGAEGGGESGRDPVAIVEKVLSDNGSVSEDARTNSVIVTDVPAQFPLIEETITALDVPVSQVLLEVEMLDVSKILLDQIGIKYPQTWIQYADGTTNTNVQWQTSWPIPPGKAESKALATLNPATRLSQVGQFTIFSGGITVDMLATDTRTKFLARPRILTLSNETAEIRISQEEAIGGTQTTAGTAATVTTGAAERAETGVTLRVTPQVDDKAGLVTLYVEPTVTKTGSAVSFTIAGSSSTYKNPETRQTKSVVRLKDGETIVLGGLIRNDKKTTITKVPLLGDIPFLGKLFSHKDDDEGEERELIVFITPHIIRDFLTTTVLGQREQTLSFEPYLKEQTLVADRERKIDEALDKVAVKSAMPK